jgi:CHAT domain-containing protein
LLTAYEVLGMDLVGTEIVQLVACESGLGTTPDGQGSPGLRQAQGESVAGLRQAFIIAGAQSLVMSLWPVPLDDTAAQMQSFLGGWLSRELPRYQAFRASQLAALGRARRLRGNGHPFWWAGFVYLGNPGDR